MPKAIIDLTEVERYELKSCPGGFVVLRKLTYGQWLQRQQDSMNMSMEGRRGSNEMKADITMMQKKVAVWEFTNCIVEHNLEDAEGRLLDFKQMFTLDILDPRVGQEIGDYITKMNEFADSGNS